MIGYSCVDCLYRCGLSHSLDDEDVVQVLKSKTAAAEDGARGGC